MTNEQRARELGHTIFSHEVSYNDAITLLTAAFAEVRSDTLSDAENAAFQALTRHGFTGARYCVIAAIRGLIDTPTEPAAPDPTKVLIKAARAMEEAITMRGIGSATWETVDKAREDLRAALRLAEDDG